MSFFRLKLLNVLMESNEFYPHKSENCNEILRFRQNINNYKKNKIIALRYSFFLIIIISTNFDEPCVQFLRIYAGPKKCYLYKSEKGIRW